MPIFDSHTHLDDPVYDKDRDQVFARAREAGVLGFMIAGITAETCPRAVALAASRDDCIASVGVHPHDARSLTEDSLARLENLAAHEKVRAWGETGLDFNRMFSPREDQEKGFARQLQSAARLGLPLILHERDSGGRLLAILKEHFGSGPIKGVVHCFSGTREELSAYLALGLCIGVTGVLTQKERGKPLRRMLPSIPPDRLLIETDCPYLTPAPQRNKHRRNEPAFLTSVVETAGRVLGKDPREVAQLAWDNAIRLFGPTERMIQSP
ncbi:MAG: TatD family hydrolase [Deltaproteobacteria bacterium]|nr:TatD family hydrolase [Deltaproteobacteria bacterium]